MVDQLKIYPVWSNVIYFVAAFYAFFISLRSFSLKLKFALFLLYAFIILFAGIFSIMYHVNTPSWTGNPDLVYTERFEKWLNLDQAFAILVVVYSALFFVYRIGVYYWNIGIGSLRGKPLCKKVPFLFDPNFALSLLFIVLSVIFYGIAHNHFDKTSDCKKTACVHINLDSYDIFHSNWHIFTSIALIFWLTLLNNSYGY